MKINDTVRNCAATALLLLLGTSVSLRAQPPKYLIGPSSRYENIASYCEGMARVKISADTTGFIDTLGRQLITLAYADAGVFHNGLAWVKQQINDSDKYGFIDKSGTLVIPLLYDEVEDFSCQRAAVRRGALWQYIDKRGKAVIADSVVIGQMLATGEDHKEYTEDVKPPVFANNLALYRDENNLYGYIDTAGRKVVAAKYYAATGFSGGIALVAADTLKVALLSGEDTLAKLYNSLPSGGTGYVWRIIDTSGSTVRLFSDSLQPDVSGVTNGFISVFLRGDEWQRSYGVMDKKGRLIIAPQYYRSVQGFSEGSGFVQIDGKAEGNKDGYMLTFDSTGRQMERIAFVRQEGTMYDSDADFHEGLLAVKIGDKWGYMDVRGKMVIAPAFDTALGFYDGLAVVVMDSGELAVIKNPLYK